MNFQFCKAPMCPCLPYIFPPRRTRHLLSRCVILCCAAPCCRGPPRQRCPGAARVLSRLRSCHEQVVRLVAAHTLSRRRCPPGLPLARPNIEPAHTDTGQSLFQTTAGPGGGQRCKSQEHSKVPRPQVERHQAGGVPGCSGQHCSGGPLELRGDVKPAVLARL